MGYLYLKFETKIPQEEEPKVEVKSSNLPILRDKGKPKLDIATIRAMLPPDLAAFIGTPCWTSAMEREMREIVLRRTRTDLLRKARCFLADRRNWCKTGESRLSIGPVDAYTAISRFKSDYNAETIVSAVTFLIQACERIFKTKCVSHINDGTTRGGEWIGTTEDENFANIHKIYNLAVEMSDNEIELRREAFIR